jgi:ABC-type glutathione transport system ATPase component
MSDSVRVYEIADETGSSSAEVIAKAKDLNIELKSPQSAVSFEDAEDIAKYILSGISPRIIPKRRGLKIVKRKQTSISELKTLDNEVEKDSEKDTEEQSRLDMFLNSYPKITIEITNLKTIKNIKWELQKEKGVYAIIGENGSGKSSILISIAKLVQPNIFQQELTGSHYENTEIKYTINSKECTWIKNSTTSNNWRQQQTDIYIICLNSKVLLNLLYYQVLVLQK